MSLSRRPASSEPKSREARRSRKTLWLPVALAEQLVETAALADCTQSDLLTTAVQRFFGQMSEDDAGAVFAELADDLARWAHICDQLARSGSDGREMAAALRDDLTVLTDAALVAAQAVSGSATASMLARADLAERL